MNNLFDPFGGVLPDILLDETALRLIEGQRTLFRSALFRSGQIAHPDCPLNGIDIQFINNHDINAVAFERERCECVGIYAGAIMILLDTLFALLASPNVFQWIGAPQKECLSEVNLKAYLHRDRDRNYGTHTPKDEFRYTAALFLTSLAGLFICSHEVGHIVKGHLKFLRSSGDWSVLQEYMYSMPEQKHLQYGRLMEWDADAQGIKIAFGWWRSSQVSGLWPDKATQWRAWMIAFAVLFSLFHARSKSWNTRAFSIHPSPRDRFLNACQIGANLAKDVDKAELTDFLTGMHLVFPEIADLQDKTQLGFTVEKLNVDAWVAEEFLAIHKEISVFEVEYLFDLMKARAREIS